MTDLQKLPDIQAMLEDSHPLFVGIYAGEDPHTDEPHISWVQAREQMRPGDRLFIMKKGQMEMLEHPVDFSQWWAFNARNFSSGGG